MRCLMELVEGHDGVVPLNSRLLAQWIRRAYLRDSIFLHGAISAPFFCHRWVEESGSRRASGEA